MKKKYLQFISLISAFTLCVPAIFCAVSAEETSNEVIYGDSDNNGIVNTYDFQFMKEWLVNNEDNQINMLNSDMNQDSVVNISDLICLQFKLLDRDYEINPYAHLSDLIKTYSGTYVQDYNNYTTRLDFSIRSIESDGTVNAVYNFHAHEDAPSVPSGSYSISGKITEVNDNNEVTIDFNNASWIYQPSNYYIIKFIAHINAEHTAITSDSNSINLLSCHSNEFEDISGKYSGTYVAGQGLTNLTLTIPEEFDGYETTALFEFSANSSNPGVPSGSFYCSGTVTGVSEEGIVYLAIKGKEWIDRPSLYSMLDFTAEINPKTGELISGSYKINLTRE